MDLALCSDLSLDSGLEFSMCGLDNSVWLDWTFCIGLAIWIVDIGPVKL